MRFLRPGLVNAGFVCLPALFFNQSINQSIKSVSQSIDRWIDRSIDRSTDQSMNLVNTLRSVFYASVLLLIMNFVITLSKIPEWIRRSILTML